MTIRLNEWQFSFVLVLGLKILLIMSPPRCDRQSRPMRHRPCKNIPPEALPACENDQNYYTLTARSQFLQSKPIKKRSVYFWNDNPSITSASKGQPQLFLTFSSTCQRFFPGNATDVIIPPHPTPDYRMWMCGNANEDHRA